ncbi:MAG: IS21-like element helper ATPase IstB [Gemmatimonadota bacterium]|nr:MAG: IS21-like element helper ATPase IstB [Gemmatimonadota bacterium]
MVTRARKGPTNSPTLRDRLLEHFAVLRVAITPEQLDTAVARAEREGLSHLAFLEAVIAEPADRRRERSIQRRIHEARFREVRMLETFDWLFNARSIDRLQIETLVSGDFIRRGDNLVIVGQSGVGKSHIIQAVGRHACALGHRVRYTTSAALLVDLTASLADQTLPSRLRHYGRPELLIIDEFGFDKIERSECQQAASLLYKIIDARSQQRSTALVSNIDFDAWADYLGDPPLVMALLDRLVDGAIILKIKGKSYRAHRAKRLERTSKASNP